MQGEGTYPGAGRQGRCGRGRRLRGKRSAGLEELPGGRAGRALWAPGVGARGGPRSALSPRPAPPPPAPSLSRLPFGGCRRPAQSLPRE